MFNKTLITKIGAIVIACGLSFALAPSAFARIDQEVHDDNGSNIVAELSEKIVRAVEINARHNEKEEKAQPIRMRLMEKAFTESQRCVELMCDPNRTEWTYVEPVKPTVYLTFDDGPSSITSDILDVLDRYDVKATFFVTAQYPDYQDMIGEAYRRGHAIAMHTYSHDYETVYASDEAYFEDLSKIAAIVEDQIGYVPFMVRFPGGSSNTISANYSNGIMSRVSAELIARGYQYYDWNAVTGDGGTVNAQEAYDNAVASIGKHDVVMLAHDTAAKQSTLDALPGIIEAYKAAGYDFSTITRTSYVPHHGIAN